MIRLVFDLANYKINWSASLAFQTFETALIIALLGLAVLIHERGSLVSRLFLIMCWTASTWFFSLAWMCCAANAGVALWWAKFGYLGVPSPIRMDGDSLHPVFCGAHDPEPVPLLDGL